MENKTRWGSLWDFNRDQEYFNQLLGLTECQALKILGFDEPYMYVFYGPDSYIKKIDQSEDFSDSSFSHPAWTRGQVEVWLRKNKKQV